MKDCSELIYGVGISRKGKYKRSENGRSTKCYKSWVSMLDRCYNNIPETYKNVRVCSEWHEYQVFAEWYHNNYKEGFDIDKDILNYGCDNPEYSPSKCTFIPRIINNVIRDFSSYNSGCTYKPLEGKYQVRMNKYGKSINIGRFKTFKEGSCVYRFERSKYIKELAQMFYDNKSIDFNVYNKLLEISKDDRDHQY